MVESARDNKNNFILGMIILGFLGFCWIIYTLADSGDFAGLGNCRGIEVKNMWGITTMCIEDHR